MISPVVGPGLPLVLFIVNKISRPVHNGVENQQPLGIPIAIHSVSCTSMAIPILTSDRTVEPAGLHSDKQRYCFYLFATPNQGDCYVKEVTLLPILCQSVSAVGPPESVSIAPFFISISTDINLRSFEIQTLDVSPFQALSVVPSR